MKEINAAYVLNWIAERFQYVIVVLLIILSATFYTVFTPDNNHYSAIKRGFSIAFAVVLMGLIVGGMTHYYAWNWFVSSIISVALGVGAPKLSFWLLRLWQKSDTPEELLSQVGRIGKAANAAKADWFKSAPPDKPEKETEEPQ